VDDDANNRDMLSRRLVRRGYSVEVAESGQEALEKIEAAQYDLVLLDQMMPGMSGLDLLRLLRATRSQIELPVIMVTAVDHSQFVVDALASGANDYVVKRRYPHHRGTQSGAASAFQHRPRGKAGGPAHRSR